METLRPQLPSLFERVDENRIPVIVAGVLISLAWFLPRIKALLQERRARSILSKYPLVNPKWNDEDKKKLYNSSEELLFDGMALAKGGPFRVKDTSNTKLILPPKYVEEIKNKAEMDNQSFLTKDFHANYPGFEVFSTSKPEVTKIFVGAIKVNMVPALPLTIAPMLKELPNTMDLVYGKAKDWKEIVIYQAVLTTVSRITQLVFLGEKLMNNPEWQDLAVKHSVNVQLAAAALTRWPVSLRPIVHWFIPECRKAREQIALARRIIGPEVQQRIKEMQANGGKPRRRVLDSVDWFVASNKDNKPFDYAVAEVALAMAAINTSANTFGFLIGDLISHPEYVQPLRDELVSVLTSRNVMDKATFYNLKLMDSFMKESMRAHPHASANMRRHTLKEVILSDGTVIPNDTYVMVGPTPMRDPAKWGPNPSEFDGYRFLKMRQQPGHENKHQFTSVSDDCTMFDNGMHACPGRFLAAYYLKMIFAYLILNYDFKLLPGQSEYDFGAPAGYYHRPSFTQKVLYRSRKPEVDLTAVSVEA